MQFKNWSRLSLIVIWVAGCLVLVTVGLFYRAPALAWGNGANSAMLPAQPDYGPNAGETCFATADSGTTVFSSTNADAVQQAVDAAGSGDIVRVAGYCAGVHEVAHAMQTVHIPKPLILRGGYTTTDWLTSYPVTQPTTLDAQGLGRVINAIFDIAVIDMTVQNGNIGGSAECPSGCGGGIFAVGALNLGNVNILSSTATNDGGGAYAFGAAWLSGGLFQNNQCTSVSCRGGGLSVYSTLTLTGTRFLGNAATGSGGGAYVTSGVQGDSRLVNGLFARNKATNAAALYLIDTTLGIGTADVIHTTIASPTLSSGPAIYVGNGTVNITNTIFASYTIGISNTSGTVTEDYNLFWGNTVTEAGSISPGAHSFTGNPAFVNSGTDDYHLTTSSAAIDAGVNAGVTTDLDGFTRPFGSAYDIGAYEAQSVDCVAITAADYFFTPTAPHVGQPVSFSAVITGGMPPITYTWNFGHGGDVHTATAVIEHSFPLTYMLKTYTVTLMASSACSSRPANPREVTIQPFAVYLPIVILGNRSLAPRGSPVFWPSFE